MNVISGLELFSILITGINVMKANVKFEMFATLPAKSLSCFNITMLMKLSRIAGQMIVKMAEAGSL